MATHLTLVGLWSEIWGRLLVKEVGRFVFVMEFVAARRAECLARP